MKHRFDNITMKASRAIRHWWIFAIAGVLGIILGIAVFFFPLQSYVVLSILFGITEPFFLFFNRNKDKGMPPRKDDFVNIYIEEPRTDADC